MPVPPCPSCSKPNLRKLDLTSAFVDYYRCEAGHILTVDKTTPGSGPSRSSPGSRIEGCPARQGDFNCCQLPLNR
jgi:hypothetical protein